MSLWFTTSDAARNTNVTKGPWLILLKQELRFLGARC
jgi:hypothetical protein